MWADHRIIIHAHIAKDAAGENLAAFADASLYVRQADGWRGGTVPTAHHRPRLIRLPQRLILPLHRLPIWIDKSSGQTAATRKRMPVPRACLLVVAFLALLLAPRSMRAQSSEGVLLESNEQLFCVLAALNAAGYDTGVRGSGEARRMVREYLQAQNAPILPELKKFYAAHRVPNDSARDLGQYISLALLAGPAPDFNLTVKEEELPPDARDVAGFLPLLRTYYAQAKMLNIWSEVQNQYDAAVARYTDSVRQSFALTDAYLRFPAGGYLGRTYAIYIDLLGEPEQVHARIYGMNYFLVITPSQEPKLEEIRFQYLHFLLDPLAAKYAYEINQKSRCSAPSRVRRRCWDWILRMISAC